MTGKQIREALHRGDRVYGTCIVSPSPVWPAAIKRIGLDFVFIDTEHTPIDRHQLSWMCRTYRAIEVAPIVRIPSPDPYEACKALDAGAQGIIGPYIESVEQVKRLVGATKYRPLKGQKLEEFLECGEERDANLVEYLRSFNENSVLIANIESRPAMKSLDEIVSVEGLDGVLIGPHDLSISLGIPEQYGHADFDAAVREIFQKARAHGIGAGIHWWFGVDAQVAWTEAGANLIVNNSDVTAFEQRTAEEMDQIRKALGDTKPIGDDSGEVI